MENLAYLLVIALHIYTIYDAFKYIRKRNGGFRVVLAFLPPLIGPIIYLLTKSRATDMQKKKVFMNRKRRFS